MLLGLFLSGFGGLLTPIFAVGFALVANNIQKGEPISFERFFDGFNNRPGHLILVALVSSIIVLGFFIPLIASFIGEFISAIVADTDPDFSDINWGLTAILAFVAIIPAIYLGIAWLWANYFVVFKGLDFWPAMEASRKIITREWFSFLGFSIVLGFISLLGFMCFIVGALVTTPLVSIAAFIAFEQIVGLNEDDEMDIADHLIDEDFG